MTVAEAYVADTIARAIAPRNPLSVSQWSAREIRLSDKSSPEPGQWKNERNPLLVEPMDCMSAKSIVRDVVLKFPIQFGKSQIAQNVVGYSMCENPGPIMVALPSEALMLKWVAQKLDPMIEETEAVQRALTSLASRDATNTRTFKDFAGGQLYMEHAGTPGRLKSTSVKILVVDELDEFVANLQTGDDPLDMLDGRTSAYEASYRRLYISTPGLVGVSRIEIKWLKSDQRWWHVPCPHCQAQQPLVWDGLKWNEGATACWYVCRDCGSVIDERHKTTMIAAGGWVPQNPEAKIRGYTANCLYYPVRLGPGWLSLVHMWLDAQNDNARIKTFVNERRAECYEDPSMRAVRHNVIADRAEDFRLRTAPKGVLAITAGVDTQDNRLPVQIIGWGRGRAWWTIDYVELPGDPAEEKAWVALIELLNKPIQHESGALMRVLASCVDLGGHRTEAVKNFVRQRRIVRPMAIFGAVPNNAPILSKGKPGDVTWGGRTDRRGVMIYQVGTVAAKHHLFSQLATDADKDSAEQRVCHFSNDLGPEYFVGLTSEVYDPAKNRFRNRRGARNEPLDTWVYAYAATHHPELRFHRYTRADWDAREANLMQSIAPASAAADPTAAAPGAARSIADLAKALNG